LIRTDALVISNINIGADNHLIRLRAPQIARDGQPGQFIEIRCSSTWTPLLRRPISLFRIGRHASGYSADEISILVRVVGEGSRLISKTRPGETLDIIGPLGKGFTLAHSTRRILLVAGGLGLAPLVALADEAISKEISVVLLQGAETGERIVPARYLPPEIEYQICTDDGSLGRCDLVTNLCPEYLDWADQVCACGPSAMLPALVTQVRDMAIAGRRIPVQVSLEARMACGVGACLSCVVDTRHGKKRVCKDGPVFDLSEVNAW